MRSSRIPSGIPQPQSRSAVQIPPSRIYRSRPPPLFAPCRSTASFLDAHRGSKLGGRRDRSTEGDKADDTPSTELSFGALSADEWLPTPPEQAVLVVAFHHTGKGCTRCGGVHLAVRYAERSYSPRVAGDVPSEPSACSPGRRRCDSRLIGTLRLAPSPLGHGRILINRILSRARIEDGQP